MENHNQEIEDKAMLLQLATPSVDMKERAMRPIIEISKLHYQFQTHQSMLIIQKKHSQT